MHELTKLMSSTSTTSAGPFETTVSVEFLLSLHNALDVGHPLRNAVIDHIQKVGAKNAKAHWTRAIVQTESGNLIVDDSLYNVAVYRGKQETRMKAAEEAFKTLQEQLEFLHSFHEKEQSAAAVMAPKGVSLVGIRELGRSLQHLKKHVNSLAETAKRMKSGLANNVAGTGAPDEDQSVLDTGK